MLLNSSNETARDQPKTAACPTALHFFHFCKADIRLRGANSKTVFCRVTLTVSPHPRFKASTPRPSKLHPLALISRSEAGGQEQQQPRRRRRRPAPTDRRARRPWPPWVAKPPPAPPLLPSAADWHAAHRAIRHCACCVCTSSTLVSTLCSIAPLSSRRCISYPSSLPRRVAASFGITPTATLTTITPTTRS